MLLILTKDQKLSLSSLFVYWYGEEEGSVFDKVFIFNILIDWIGSFRPTSQGTIQIDAQIKWIQKKKKTKKKNKNTQKICHFLVKFKWEIYKPTMLAEKLDNMSFQNHLNWSDIADVNAILTIVISEMISRVALKPGCF